MNPRGKKLEPKLKLDMPFDEVLARFLQTKPSEVEESIERSKSVIAPMPKSPKRTRLRKPKG
jgi:hypothetical protein